VTDSHNAIQTVEVRAIEPNPGHSIAPVVSAILAQNPTAEALGQLMALQERWEDREARRAFAAARVRLRAELPPVILRDQKVAFGKTSYTHSSLAQVMRVVTPILSAHGFDLAHRTDVSGNKVRVTAILTHLLGHSEETTLEAPIDTAGSKSPAQGVASTVTLLQRYTAVALLGLATADMVEPQGEPEPEDLSRIDPRKNMELAGFIRGQRFMVEDAEGYVGRTADKWTAQDRLDLREWLKAQRDGKVAASPAPKADAGPAFSLEGDEEYTTDDDAPQTGRRTR